MDLWGNENNSHLQGDRVLISEDVYSLFSEPYSTTRTDIIVVQRNQWPGEEDTLLQVPVLSA